MDHEATKRPHPPCQLEESSPMKKIKEDEIKVCVSQGLLICVDIVLFAQMVYSAAVTLLIYCVVLLVS